MQSIQSLSDKTQAWHEPGGRSGLGKRIKAASAQSPVENASEPSPAEARAAWRAPFTSARWLPWLLPSLLLLIWEGSVRAGWLNARVLPEPWSVVTAAWRLFQSGQLAEHAAVSARRAGLGLLVGGSAGFVLGVVNGYSQRSKQLFDTPVQMIRNIPHLALLPMVILWFGLGESAKVFLVALGVLFPMYVNTMHGIASIDPGLLEMARVYRLSKVRTFRHILLPGALPSILVGLRFSLGVMWLSLIVAETIAADSGIGYLAMNAREFMQTDVVVMSILLYALLGKLADKATQILEHRFLGWDAHFAKQ